AAEIGWPESSTHYQNGNNSAFVQIEDEAPSTPAAPEVSGEVKGIDVVFAEKGIVVAEDDGGIPSDVLRRLASPDPADRQAALAEVVRVGGDDAFRCICKAFDDQAVEVRNAAANALFDLQPDRAA